MKRYQRQIILDEIGSDGQAKLAQARILCIGAGGLGSPALLYLAAAGVGHIGIVDFDVVDESNLHRQILFGQQDVGLPKVERAAARLRDLNPEVDVVAHAHRLDEKSAAELFPRYDLVIDGTDNFAAKYLINDAAVKYEKPCIYGAIQGFDGQVAVFEAQKGACYRCLYPQEPKARIQNCAEAGVIGPVAGLIGLTQAMQVIQIITGHGSFKPLYGRLWMIDMRNMESRILSIPKNPDCPVCSGDIWEVPLRYASPVCGLVPELTVAQARYHKNALFVDVREDHEWQGGHIKGAAHLPLSALRQGHKPDLPMDQDLILYCQAGLRSAQAADILRAQGYLNLYNMVEGYSFWQATFSS